MAEILNFFFDEALAVGRDEHFEVVDIVPEVLADIGVCDGFSAAVGFDDFLGRFDVDAVADGCVDGFEGLMRDQRHAVGIVG